MTTAVLSRSSSEGTGILTNLPARPAKEIYTREQWFNLCWHLHNRNGDFDYGIGWFGLNTKNGGTPEAIYSRSKRTPVSKAIPWAWSSLCGKGHKKIAVVFYPKNAAGQSRWAGVDFAAHSTDPEEQPVQAREAQANAMQFFRSVLNIPGIYVILEMSGRGWHVWLLSKDFRPCDDWTALLADKLVECGITIEGLELFPPVGAIASRFSRGMRAPGCWSPAKQTPSLILFENFSQFLTENREVGSPKREKDISLSSLSLYSHSLPYLELFAIHKVSTRHNLLLSLTGSLFHQVGRGMAERFASEQFTRSTRKPKSTEQGHLRDFGDCWSGLHQKWLASLSPAERAAYEALHTELERDAFRIIRSFAGKATKDNSTDFRIVRDDLAARIGMTGKGAGLLVQRFIEAGILKRSAEYVPHKFAARYQFTLTKEVHQ
jgi:hypothetical protein